MRLAFLPSTFIVTAALAVSGNANAILVTLDSPIVTVVRPASGTLAVDFTGHIDVTAGFEITSFSRSGNFNSAGDRTFGSFASPTFATDGVLFRVTIDSTDLGLYDLDFDLVAPSWFVYAECPIGGGFCNNTGRISFGVNVVDALPVPEPATLALLGAGLVGLVGLRRRRQPTA